MNAIEHFNNLIVYADASDVDFPTLDITNTMEHKLAKIPLLTTTIQLLDSVLPHRYLFMNPRRAYGVFEHQNLKEVAFDNRGKELIIHNAIIKGLT